MDSRRASTISVLRLLVLVVLSVVALFVFWNCLPIGLRRSDATITADLLRITPLGSSPEAVMDAIRERKWRHYGYHAAGFLKQIPGWRPEEIGVSSIRASLGDYH